MRANGILVACAFLCAAAQSANAQQSDGPLKSVAKIFGFATDVKPPADFVTQSRPAKDGEYIPIFQPPPEPKKPVLNDKQFKAMKGDLDSVQTRDDGLRAGFAPSAKAVAEAKAAEQKAAVAKAAAKTQANPSAPQQ